MLGFNEPISPRYTETIVIQTEWLRIDLSTIRKKYPSFFLYVVKLSVLNIFLVFYTKIYIRKTGKLSSEKIFVVIDKNIGVLFLISEDHLSIVDGAGNDQGIMTIDSKAVYIFDVR